MSIEWTKKRRLLSAGLVAGALATGVTVVSRPAEAAVDPVTVTAWIKAAQEMVKLIGSIFDLAGRDLSSQLEGLRTQILQDMKTLRNQELISEVNTVIALYRELSNNHPNDPVNDELYVELLVRQHDTATAMYDIIQSDADVQSSYELAPAYNVLIHAGNNVLRAKEFIHPQFPSRWEDYYLWNQPAIDADYELVGSQRFQCWPGKNPGYRPKPSPFNTNAYTAWMTTTQPGLYKDSQLWTKKLANKGVTVLKKSMTCHGSQGFSTSYVCNPGTRKCSWTAISGCIVGPITYRRCAEGTPSLVCADANVQPGWDADPVVKIVRASMTHIQKLSGGNDYDAPNNDALTSQGKIVDPWVNEPACGAGAPWAYPHQP
jgi:hypothetical protein